MRSKNNIKFPDIIWIVISILFWSIPKIFYHVFNSFHFKSSNAHKNLYIKQFKLHFLMWSLVYSIWFVIDILESWGEGCSEIRFFSFLMNFIVRYKIKCLLYPSAVYLEYRNVIIAFKQWILAEVYGWLHLITSSCKEISKCFCVIKESEEISSVRLVDHIAW